MLTPPGKDDAPPPPPPTSTLINDCLMKLIVNGTPVQQQTLGVGCPTNFVMIYLLVIISSSDKLVTLTVCLFLHHRTVISRTLANHSVEPVTPVAPNLPSRSKSDACDFIWFSYWSATLSLSWSLLVSQIWVSTGDRFQTLNTQLRLCFLEQIIKRWLFSMSTDASGLFTFSIHHFCLNYCQRWPSNH